MNEEDKYLNEMKKAYAIRDSELKSQFKTMLFSYRNALGMLSGLKNELDEVVSHIDNLDIETISNFYKPVLEKANDLVSKIELLDYEMKNHSDMKAYLASIKTQLKSHNIDTWVRKLDEVKYQIIKAKEAEERRKQELQRQRNEEAKRQAELERQRNEELKRQAELERQRNEEAEERRKQELQRQRNEEAKRQAELERQRNEELKRQAELERQRNEEAKRQAELERQQRQSKKKENIRRSSEFVSGLLAMYISAILSIDDNWFMFVIVMIPFFGIIELLCKTTLFDEFLIIIYNKLEDMERYTKIEAMDTSLTIINFVIALFIYFNNHLFDLNTVAN